MKKLLLAVTLTCVLSGAALAGEMPAVSPLTASDGAQPRAETVLPGEIPGVDSAAPFSGTEPSAAVAVLLAIINLVV